MSDAPTNTLVKWLESKGCYDVRPGLLRIGRQEWSAAYYKRDREVNEGTRAYQEGQRVYTTEAIYALGRVPKAYQKGGKLCFTRAGDEREWYVAGWYPVDNFPRSAKQTDTDTTNEYHPFGRMFTIQPWSVPDGRKIDYAECRPYRRMRMEFIDLLTVAETLDRFGKIEL